MYIAPNAVLRGAVRGADRPGDIVLTIDEFVCFYVYVHLFDGFNICCMLVVVLGTVLETCRDHALQLFSAAWPEPWPIIIIIIVIIINKPYT